MGLGFLIAEEAVPLGVGTLVASECVHRVEYVDDDYFDEFETLRYEG